MWDGGRGESDGRRQLVEVSKELKMDLKLLRLRFTALRCDAAGGVDGRAKLS